MSISGNFINFELQIHIIKIHYLCFLKTPTFHAVKC